MFIFLYFLLIMLNLHIVHILLIICVRHPLSRAKEAGKLRAAEAADAENSRGNSAAAEKAAEAAGAENSRGSSAAAEKAAEAARRRKTRLRTRSLIRAPRKNRRKETDSTGFLPVLSVLAY